MTRLLQFCCAIVVVIIALLHSADAIAVVNRNRFLTAHNNYRLKHHAPKLTYSPRLENAAQRVANTCKMIHSNGPYGENLAWGYKTATDATDAWYNEVVNYNYDQPGYGEHTGHFTQVVWKDTTEIGCGIRKCRERGNDYFMFVCAYNQPGNIVGNNNSHFKDNVLPP